MTEVEFLPLFDRWNGMVYALALSVTRSPQDAEDISQEVFLTLLERPPAPGKERAWLARVTVNRCRDLLRSPWRRRREDLDQADRELAFSQPEEGVLYEALGALEPEVRALLHLRFYEGFGVAELARQKYALVLANIVADVIIPLSARAGEFLDTDGVFLCSGIIDTRAGEVEAALERNGLAVFERREQNGWVALAARAAR